MGRFAAFLASIPTMRLLIRTGTLARLILRFFIYFLARFIPLAAWQKLTEKEARASSVVENRRGI